MKKLTGVLFILFFAIPFLHAEETLIGSRFESGGYGGPVFAIGSVNGHTGLLSGGRGGWIINHTIALGGGGYELILDVPTDLSGDGDIPLEFDMAYGGFEIEYIHRSDKLLHWTLHALIGGGSARLEFENSGDKFASDEFFIVEPGFEINLNVNRWFRLGMGISHRIIGGLNLEGMESADIQGTSVFVIFKFGSF